MDQKIVKFYDFRIEILTLEDDPIFSKWYSDTVELNIFEDAKFNGQLWPFSTDTIPGLKQIEDSIVINYSLKFIDTLGVESIFEQKNLKFVRTKYRRFGSFF